MALKIPNGESEPIFTVALMDTAGAALTGLSSVYIRIRRDSDGYFWDFADNTFKASPGTIQAAMTEIDATLLPGVYRYLFDLGSVTNEAENDTYFFHVTCSSAVNAPQEGQIITTDLAAKAGWGDRTFTPTVNDSDSNPIIGATVQIRDATGAVVIGKNITDVAGQCVFLLDDGSYRVYVYASGYSASNPYVLTIAGDSAATYTLAGDGVLEVTPPDSPDVCRVYGYCKDVSGNPIQYVNVTAELSSSSAYVTGAASGTMLTETKKYAVSDADGYWYVDLIPNESLEVLPATAIGEPSGENDTVYRFRFDGPNDFKRLYKSVTVPDETTQDFSELI